MLTFTIYLDKRSQYRWRCQAENGKIIATSGGDGYHNLADCEAMISRLKAGVAEATIVYQWDNGEG